MTTPWRLIIHKNDPWWVKLEKKVARWLWNDLTRLPKPAEGYPGEDERLSALRRLTQRRFEER